MAKRVSIFIMLLSLGFIHADNPTDMRSDIVIEAVENLVGTTNPDNLNVKQKSRVTDTLLYLLGYSSDQKQTGTTDDLLNEAKELLTEDEQDRLATALQSESLALFLLMEEIIFYGENHGKTPAQIASALIEVQLQFARHGGACWFMRLLRRVNMKKDSCFAAIYTKTVQAHKDTATWCSDWITTMRRSWKAFNFYLSVRRMTYLPHVVLGVTAFGAASKALAVYKGFELVTNLLF